MTVFLTERSRFNKIVGSSLLALTVSFGIQAMEQEKKPLNSTNTNLPSRWDKNTRGGSGPDWAIGDLDDFFKQTDQSCNQSDQRCTKNNQGCDQGQTQDPNCTRNDQGCDQGQTQDPNCTRNDQGCDQGQTQDPNCTRNDQGCDQGQTQDPNCTRNDQGCDQGQNWNLDPGAKKTTCCGAGCLCPNCVCPGSSTDCHDQTQKNWQGKPEKGVTPVDCHQGQTGDSKECHNVSPISSQPGYWAGDQWGANVEESACKNRSTQDHPFYQQLAPSVQFSDWWAYKVAFDTHRDYKNWNNTEWKNVFFKGMSLKHITLNAGSFNNVRWGGSFISISFRDRQFTDVTLLGHFEGVDFTGARFSRVKFSNVTFKTHYLHRIDFSDTNWEDVVFVDSIIDNVKFDGAKLKHVYVSCGQVKDLGAFHNALIWDDNKRDFIKLVGKKRRHAFTQKIAQCKAQTASYMDLQEFLH